MIISYKAGLVYLAAPKTGSTAIEAQLRPASDVIFQGNAHSKHLMVREYRALLEPLLKHVSAPRLELCAVVRDPVDWIRSWYRYRMREQEQPKFSTRGLSFEDFVEGFARRPKPVFTHFIGNQARFFADRNGPMGVDHLFRHDQMSLFFEFLEQRYGRSFEFRRLNVSPQVDFEVSPATEQRIRDLFAADQLIYDQALRPQPEGA